MAQWQQQGQEMKMLDNPPDKVVYVVQPVQVVPRQSFTGHIIFSCCVFWCCGAVFGLVAFILAMLATNNVDRNPPEATRFGKASLIVSIVGLILGILFIIIYVVVFVIRVVNVVHDIRTHEWEFDWGDHNKTSLFDRDFNRTTFF